MRLNFTQTGDILSLPKNGIGGLLVKHKILCVNDGFIHNHPNTGVDYVNPNTIDFAAAKIEKFTGSAHEAQNLDQRAKQQIGKSYHANDYNCEHFVHEVRDGIAVSPQANTANAIANTALAVGGIAAASLLLGKTKSSVVKWIAFIGIFIGLLTKLVLHTIKS